ncbi:MAG TPA: pilus assembly protein TadG-related protein [Candidatus Nanopelagicales bacterium]|nr:pilus assembly protein TadG-related protein [Candidatus Nanopelagicales bacterium]
MRLRTDDRGSVLPLVIGVVAIVLTLVTVVTDVSVLWLQRRALQATVDGAALAGAQAVDLPAVYAGGAHGDLALDPRAARSAVRGYVRAVPTTLRSLRVASVVVSGSRVTVRATAVASPPFLALLTGRGITVVAEASAITTAG